MNLRSSGRSLRAVFIVLHTFNLTYPDISIEWLHVFALNFILRVFMTQNCIKNLFFADIELFFAKKYAMADSLYPPTEKG